MRRLSNREEFARWCGKQDFSVSATESLLACSAKLHRLATEECNGFRDTAAEERNAAAQDKARRALREVLDGTQFVAVTSDHWKTVRLVTHAERAAEVAGTKVPA
jgi:hypothetical protein